MNSVLTQVINFSFIFLVTCFDQFLYSFIRQWLFAFLDGIFHLVISKKSLSIGVHGFKLCLQFTCCRRLQNCKCCKEFVELYLTTFWKGKIEMLMLPNRDVDINTVAIQVSLQNKEFVGLYLATFYNRE